MLPLPSSEESFDHQLKSVHDLLVIHCVCHLRDFHGHPRILHTIQKPVY
jgi:hypothetical protein